MIYRLTAGIELFNVLGDEDLRRLSVLLEHQLAIILEKRYGYAVVKAEVRE